MFEVFEVFEVLGVLEVAEAFASFGILAKSSGSVSNGLHIKHFVRGDSV